MKTSIINIKLVFWGGVGAIIALSFTAMVLTAKALPSTQPRGDERCGIEDCVQSRTQTGIPLRVLEIANREGLNCPKGTIKEICFDYDTNWGGIAFNWFFYFGIMMVGWVWLSRRQGWIKP